MKYRLFFLLLTLFETFRCGAQGTTVSVLGTDIRPNEVSCFGLSDGTIRIALITGVPPLTYQWSGQGLSGNGILTNLDPIDIYTGMPPGDYIFNLTNGAGEDTIVTVVVLEPPELSGIFNHLSSYNGYDVSCAGGRDGVVRFTPSGGTPSYMFKWSNGTTGAFADSLFASKTYTVTLTDQNGCTAVRKTTLTAPPPITDEIYARGDKCYGENAGIIEVKSISGGIGPYQIVFNNSLPGVQKAWLNLIPGTYFLSIADANGCVKQEGVVLPTGLMFILDAGPDSSMYSGDTLRYTLHANQPIASAAWTPSGYAEVPAPDQALLFPYFSTQFHVEAVDTNGCSANGDVFIRVHRNRSVFIPNVFAPDGSFPENRHFTVFGGGGIETIETLQVFDRFGHLWFDKHHFPVSDPQEGWSGQTGGERAFPGVYVYYAVLKFTDGREETYTGDVTLVR